MSMSEPKTPEGREEYKKKKELYKERERKYGIVDEYA